jgi:hypothetical protein
VAAGSGRRQPSPGRQWAVGTGRRHGRAAAAAGPRASAERQRPGALLQPAAACLL